MPDNQTVVFFEFDQPECERVYGTGLCVAALGTTGTHKCFNTRKTCQDPANYSPTVIKVHRFAVGQDGLLQYGTVLPFMLAAPSVAPGEINLGGMEKSASAFGRREEATIRMQDGKHSDHRFDKYRLERFTGDASLFGSGTASAGTSTSITLEEAIDDLEGKTIRTTGGTGSGQERVVLSVNGLVATVAAWSVTPDATTTYTVHDAYDPYERGTFWPRWLARNPYYVNYRCRIRRGLMGQALEDMRVWYYIMTNIAGVSEGKVTIKVKDLFSKVEARKAVFPAPSLGELNGNLTGSPATFSVLPTGIGDTADVDGGYASITASVEGHVVIGKEAIRATRTGDTFTVAQRGALGTTQEDHDDADLVQLVGYLNGQVHNNIYTLLTAYAGVPAADIPKSEWDVKVQVMSPNVYTAYVPEPTPVDDLCGELMEQAGCTVWADTSTGRIEFVPLVPVAPNVTIDDTDIVDGSLALPKQESKRISRALLYFGIRDIVEGIDNASNFHARVISPDLSAEDSTQYGEMSLRIVHSRWIAQGGTVSATQTVTRLLSIYRDPPRQADFKLHAVSAEAVPLSLAVPFVLETADVQNAIGKQEGLTMVPIKINATEAQATISAQQMRWAIDLGDPNVREIFITDDTTNVTLRTMHDALYIPPIGSETVTFENGEGVIVGSLSTSSPAMDTGLWPAGVDLYLNNFGRVQGKGGAAGNGGDWNLGNGTAGQAGGLALLARYAITIDNEFGEIWGGGGGGGAGGETHLFNVSGVGGSGGGGGSGYLSGTGGSGGAGQVPLHNGLPGSAGTTEAGGAGGGRVNGGGGARNGAGGTGGAPGAAGAAGESGFWPGFPTGGSTNPTAGGAAGAAVNGNSFITWTNMGSRLGAIT
jgi:hypothetical protein